MRGAGERGLPRSQKPLELEPTPDERPGSDQHRGQARALHRRTSVVGGLRLVVGGFQSELEDMLGAREVFQLPHTQVGEHNVVGQ